MDGRDADTMFGGSVPEAYDTWLVPLIFEPYAVDLARRIASRHSKRVLEVAAGTGVVTRAMAAALPDDTVIVSTDLNKPMLDHASAVPTRRPVIWRQADALQLPFEDGAFDTVVCQFGAMFFPDKPRAFAEARRVLAPGGLLLFNVWDRIEENEFADTVTMALCELFPSDPPRFLARTPHGYSDRETIEQDLRGGGFAGPAAFETLAARSRAPSPLHPAFAYCQGTPLRNEIEMRSHGDLATATRACADAIGARFGSTSVDGKIQAHVIAIEA
jgi:ubiquinone/menaquinone biosynthesis C-methylase UbiE